MIITCCFCYTKNIKIYKIYRMVTNIKIVTTNICDPSIHVPEPDFNLCTTSPPLSSHCSVVAGSHVHVLHHDFRHVGCGMLFPNKN